jgi:hypothetical protein
MTNTNAINPIITALVAGCNNLNVQTGLNLTPLVVTPFVDAQLFADAPNGNSINPIINQIVGFLNQVTYKSQPNIDALAASLGISAQQLNYNLSNSDMNSQIIKIINAPSLLLGTVNNTEVDLSWTSNSENQIGYHVYRSTDNINFSIIASPTAATYNDTGLASAHYYYYVTAYNANAESSPSNVIIETVIATPLSLFAVNSASSTIYKYLLSNLSPISNSNTGKYNTSPTASSSYLFTINILDAHGIYKYNKSDLSFVSTTTLAVRASAISADSNYLYALAYNSATGANSILQKYNASDMTLVSSLETSIDSYNLINDDNYIYCIDMATNRYISKYNKSNLSFVSTTLLGAGMRPSHLCLDDSYYYMTLSSMGGQIVKMLKADSSYIDVVTGTIDEQLITDGTYLYTIDTVANHSKINKYNKSDLSHTQGSDTGATLVAIAIG